MSRMRHNVLARVLEPAPAAAEAVPREEARPILKWAGGKGRLLGELVARAPTSYKRYFEPFIGGGALFFHMQPSSGVLADTNAELMRCYRAVRADVGAIID